MGRKKPDKTEADNDETIRVLTVTVSKLEKVTLELLSFQEKLLKKDKHD